MPVRDQTLRSTRALLRTSMGLPLALATISICLLGTLGCTGLPQSDAVFREETSLKGPDLIGDAAPADILIAPIRNQTDREDVPLDLLRGALHDSLVTRLYSPLDLGYTDAHWVDSAFVGDQLPEAILVASITHWSTSGLSGQGNMEIGVDLRVFRGGSTSGEALWAAHVNRVLQVVQGGHPPFGPIQELIERGAEMWAKEALAVLPERDPLAGIQQ